MSNATVEENSSAHRPDCRCDICTDSAIAALTYDEYRAMREISARQKAGRFSYLPTEVAVRRYDEQTLHFYETARAAVKQRAAAKERAT